MSESIKEMFSEISRRYDLGNAVLSAGIDTVWRKKVVRLSQIIGGMKVLDCATGTGDLALEFDRQFKGQIVVLGTDFCEPMLAIARGKARDQNSAATFEQADVMSLQYADNSFDCVTISFGLRNVDDPVIGLSELVRVCVSGGKVVVLEFGQPSGVVGFAYRFYARWLMPWIGGVITGNRSAYEYLPESASRFPAGKRFLEITGQIGAINSVEIIPLTWSVAYAYVCSVAKSD